MGAPFRHRLRITNSFLEEMAAVCTCGRGYDSVGEGVVHVKLARRWHYEGKQTFYGEDYYMWKHALTGHYYAYRDERYQRDTGVRP